MSGLALSGAGNTATMVFTTTPQELSRYSSELLVRTLEITAEIIPLQGRLHITLLT